jgi:hypothetical protein
MPHGAKTRYPRAQADLIAVVLAAGDVQSIDRDVRKSQITGYASSGSVAKIREEKTMGVKARFLLRLGNQPKQVSDEQNLSSDVPFFHAAYLPLANHIHTLIST